MTIRVGSDEGPGPTQNSHIARNAARTTTAGAKISRRRFVKNWRIAGRLSDRLHHQTGIGAAEAEAVIQHRLPLALPRLVRHEIDAFGALVRIVEVQRRRHDLVAD